MSTYRHQDRRVSAGVLLILGLTAIGLVIFYLDAIQRALQPTYDIHVVLPDAPRIGPGTRVTVAGIGVGRVTRVGLAPVNSDSLAKAVLTLELDTAVRPQVRRDSEVRLRRQRLLGDPFVDVVPGSLAAEVLQPGDTLRGRLRPPLDATLARTRDLAAALDTLQVSAEELALAWRATQPAAAAAARRASAAQAQLRRLDRAYHTGPLAEWLRDQQWRAAIARTRAAAAEIRSLFARRAAPHAAASLGPEIARLAARADTLALELARLEAALTANGGVPAPVGRDTALARAIRAARAELDSLVAETRRNPLRFFF